MGKCSAGYDACCFLQVNKEIVSGLRYTQNTFRAGVKGKTVISFAGHFFEMLRNAM